MRWRDNREHPMLIELNEIESDDHVVYNECRWTGIIEELTFFARNFPRKLHLQK